MRSPAATLMLRFIQPAEILEHHAALLGRETGQLVPGGIADFRSRAGRAGAQRGRNVDAVADRGATRAILVLVRLVAGEAATRGQQLPVQGILPLDRPPVAPRRPRLRVVAAVRPPGPPCGGDGRPASGWRARSRASSASAPAALASPPA